MRVGIPVTAVFLLILSLQILHSSRVSRLLISPDNSGWSRSLDALPSLDPASHTVPLVTPERYGCTVSRDNCGNITPSDASVFIADGARNTADGTLFFVDVPAGADGVFQIDPSTCEIVSGTYYSVNGGLSQRGIAYDANRHEIWVGSWNDYYMNQHEATPPYAGISTNYVGIAVAAGACDAANDYLYIAANSYPDYLYCYDISGGGLGSLLGAWPVPWQGGTDGYDMAGMAFDDDSGQLVMVNQQSAPMDRELFDVDPAGGLTPAGYCQLDHTAYAWGIALIEDGDPEPTSFYTYNPDITGCAPPYDVDEYGIPVVYPPYDLSCTVTVEGHVVMEWTNAEEYEEVHIYRDDELIAVLPGDATEFIDDNPPHPNIVYGVSGVIGEDESGHAECVIIGWGDGPCFDFYETDGGWTAGGTADWEWGSPSYEIDGNAWETNLGADYFNSSCGWLDSPPINLGYEGGWLSFDSYNYVECSYDGWNVQISTDGGATWSVINPVTGYDQGVPYGACDEGLSGDTNCGSGEAEGWDFDLTAYPRTTVRIRILFESDSSIAYTGLVIDDVCMSGGSLPSIEVRCRLLNPDTDGDGCVVVHIGGYLYYGATFPNLTTEPVDSGADPFYYAEARCPSPAGPIDHFGPECKGTIEAGGSATHYYRVRVPDSENLLEQNPFCVEVAAWECEGGTPVGENTRCCFDVILLPPWEPPPVDGLITRFLVEEMDGPPLLRDILGESWIDTSIE